MLPSLAMTPDDPPPEARWFDTPAGRMHYLDAGPPDAPVALLVHGNPSSGYLFRRFIAPLTRAGLRVVVPDHLGFGRSDKPEAPAALTPEAHAARLAAFVTALDLRDVTLVAHDWGAALALDGFTGDPGRLRAVAVFNGFAHAPDGSLPLPLPLRLFRVPVLGALLVRGLNLIVRAFLLGGGLAHPERLPEDARAAYLGAHPRWRDRAAMLALARAFPATAAEPTGRWLAALEARLASLPAMRVWVAWGMRDATLPPAWIARWEATFPQATVTRLDDAGHFVQEDAHERLVPALTAWVTGG